MATSETLKIINFNHFISALSGKKEDSVYSDDEIKKIKANLANQIVDSAKAFGLNGVKESSQIKSILNKGKGFVLTRYNYHTFLCYILKKQNHAKALDHTINDLHLFFSSLEDVNARPKSQSVSISELNDALNNNIDLMEDEFSDRRFQFIIQEDWKLKIIQDENIIFDPNLVRKIQTNPHLIIFDDTYWNYHALRKIQKEKLLEFYTNMNSSVKLLPYVIAKEFYVKTQFELKASGKGFSIQNFIRSNEVSELFGLVLINAIGGTGKSTLLMQLGKELYQNFNTVLIKSSRALNSLPPSNGKHSVLIIDDYHEWEDLSEDLIDSILLAYEKHGATVIMAEKNSYILQRLNDKLRKTVKGYFEEIVISQLIIKEGFYESLFNQLCKLFHLPESSKNQAMKEAFCTPSSELESTAVRVFKFLSKVKSLDLALVNFDFDWTIWTKLCSNNDRLFAFSPLYDLVAYFNYYFIFPRIEVLLELLNIKNYSIPALMKLLEEEDLPLVLKGKSILLRSDSLIKEFVKLNDTNKTARNIHLGQAINSALEGKGEHHIHLLSNFYRNRFIIKDEDMEKIIPSDDLLIKIFKTYVEVSEETGQVNYIPKTLMELYILFMRNKQPDEALEKLEQIIKKYPNESKYARHKEALHYNNIKNEDSKSHALTRYQNLINDYNDEPRIVSAYLNFLLRSKVKSSEDTYTEAFNLLDLHIDSDFSFRFLIFRIIAFSHEGYNYKEKLNGKLKELLKSGSPSWKQKIILINFYLNNNYKLELELLVKDFIKGCNNLYCVSELSSFLIKANRWDEAENLINSFQERNLNIDSDVLNLSKAQVLEYKIGIRITNVNLIQYGFFIQGTLYFAKNHC